MIRCGTFIAVSFSKCLRPSERSGLYSVTSPAWKGGHGRPVGAPVPCPTPHTAQKQPSRRCLSLSIPVWWSSYLSPGGLQASYPIADRLILAAAAGVNSNSQSKCAGSYNSISIVGCEPATIVVVGRAPLNCLN